MLRASIVLRATAAVLAISSISTAAVAAAVPEKPAAAQPAPLAPAVPGPDLVAANPGGSATLVAVVDYESPTGRATRDRLVAFAKQNPDIKIVVRPMGAGGPLSEFLAKAAYVAARQGKFLAFHDAALTAPQAHTWYSLRDSAPVLGLDWARFQQDYMDPKIAEAVRANVEFAKEQKIAAPPAFVAGGRVFAGDTPDLAQAAAAAKSGGVMPAGAK
jgi:protein-disulfide isomerase